jgi:immunity protein, SdpI family
VEPLDNAGDKVTPQSRTLNMTVMFALLLIVAQVLIAIGTYPFLPAQIPSGFDAAGHVTGYLPKLVNAILLPGISMLLFFILHFAPQLGPRLGDQNQRRTTSQVIDLIVVGVLLFVLVIQLLTTTYALGAHVDVSLIVWLAVSVLVMFLGNFLGKVRRNFWVGFRTPWTLTSDVVWERTHRLGGWLFVLVGLLGAISAFIPPLRIWGLFVPLSLVVVFLVGYSYYAYQRYTVEGREPLSPPFNNDAGESE